MKRSTELTSDLLEQNVSVMNVRKDTEMRKATAAQVIAAFAINKEQERYYRWIIPLMNMGSSLLILLT
jgi:hypothetical protein